MWPSAHCLHTKALPLRCGVVLKRQSGLKENAMQMDKGAHGWWMLETSLISFQAICIEGVMQVAVAFHVRSALICLALSDMSMHLNLCDMRDLGDTSCSPDFCENILQKVGMYIRVQAHAIATSRE